MTELLWTAEDGLVDEGCEMEEVSEEKSDAMTREAKEEMDKIEEQVQESVEVSNSTQSKSDVVERLETTKDHVEFILSENESARNSDKKLIWIYWNDVDEVSLEDFDTFKEATNPETIRRVRQEIQNQDGMYLPTDADVLKKRNFKESEIRSYYSKSKLEEIFHSSE